MPSAGAWRVPNQYTTPKLQVCTACANAFAHGSNEVANSVGPLAAIYQIWQDTEVLSNAKVDTWLLAIGGVSITLGEPRCCAALLCRAALRCAALRVGRKP